MTSISEGTQMNGKLQLVDLAGSERASSTYQRGEKVFTEAVSIN